MQIEIPSKLLELCRSCWNKLGEFSAVTTFVKNLVL